MTPVYLFIYFRTEQNRTDLYFSPCMTASIKYTTTTMLLTSNIHRLYLMFTSQKTPIMRRSQLVLLQPKYNNGSIITLLPSIQTIVLHFGAKKLCQISDEKTEKLLLLFCCSFLLFQWHICIINQLLSHNVTVPDCFGLVCLQSPWGRSKVICMLYNILFCSIVLC